TTTVHGTRSTLAQTVLRVLGALLAVAALVLVSRTRDPRPRKAFGARLRDAASHLRLVDGGVGLVLLGWWILGPAYFDDGWIVAGQQNFAHAGYFSSYYDSFGVGLSLQYWLEWLEHWLFDASSSLLILRLPALVCLVVIWVLCRWIFGRAAREGARSAALWALATMFIVGAFAWGMTLRPEPVVALLVGGVLACTVRFLERGTVAPLAIAAVLVALAVSAHPAGLVSLAPLIVAAPALYRWGRTQLSTVATILVATVALVGILALLGSDLEQLRTNTASLRAHGQETAGWRDELTRYSLLSRAL